MTCGSFNATCMNRGAQIGYLLKDAFAILASSNGDAEPFQLLGPTLDEKLLMHECIKYCTGKQSLKRAHCCVAGAFTVYADLS